MKAALKKWTSAVGERLMKKAWKGSVTDVMKIWNVLDEYDVPEGQKHGYKRSLMERGRILESERKRCAIGRP